MKKQIPILCATTIALAVTSALAGDISQQAKLTAFDAASLDFYGNSVALANRTLLVGAPNDDDIGSSSGSVYLYADTDNDGEYHDEIANKLNAFDGQSGDLFGYATAANGQTLVVSATSDDDAGSNSGSVYIYHDSNDDGDFTDEIPQKLSPFDGMKNDRFGSQLALSDKVLAVSAMLNDAKGQDSGSVYVYIDSDSDNDFAEETPQKLTAFDGASLDYYGSSIAVSDSAVVIGARNEHNYSGAAYLYFDSDKDGDFTDETAQKLTAPDGRVGKDYFASSVALSGNTLVIGAYGKDANGKSDSGAVYIYVDSDQDGDFSEEIPSTLTAVDYGFQDHFGRYVALSRYKLAVTAYQDDDKGTNSGAVYVYIDSDRDGDFTDESPEKLTASDGADYDYFGGALAITDTALVASAVQNDDAGSASGSVYTFNLPSNHGGGSFIETSQNLGNNSTLYVALADIDNDRDLDILAANINNQPNRIYINNGNGVFTDSGQELGNSYTSSLVSGDIDSDGDLDIITSNQGANYIYKNNGKGLFIDSGQRLGIVDSRSVTLGDIDKDGDLDLIVGNTGVNKVYINDGLGNYSDSGQEIGLPAGDVSDAVVLGDIDSDGDLDLLVGNSGTYGYNRVYFNNGSGLFYNSGQLFTGGFSKSIALGDIDKDGDLDMAVANNGQKNQIYINDGLGIFSRSESFSDGIYYSHGVVLGDIDGDNDLDMVVGNNAGQVNRSYLNNGSGQLHVTEQYLGNLNTPSVALGDIDGDGDPDLVFSNLNGPNKVLKNQN